MQGLRERLGVHTCDQRGKTSAFQARFPQFDIEDPLTEEDTLWMPDSRETWESHEARVKVVLDGIFFDPASTCKSDLLNTSYILS
jgi:hypothetical protein